MGRPLRKGRSMGMKVDIEALHAKFKALAPIMDERVSRLCAASAETRAGSALGRTMTRPSSQSSR